MKRFPRLPLAALVAMLALRAGADPLAPAFGDHMVLQQGVKHPVFGTVKPGAEVVVRFAGQEKKTRADERGAWRIELEPLAANATGADLVVQADASTTLHDVLVGEVWLCAGQSNMAFTVAQSAEAKALLAQPVPALLRLCDPQPRFETNPAPWPADAIRALTPANYYTQDAWAAADKAAVARFSAVGHAFGRMLQSELKVPVGLIDVGVGGTPAESWVPRAAVLADPALAGLEKDWPASALNQSFISQRAAQNMAAAVKAGADAHAMEHPYRPGFMHAAAIAPHAGLPIAGVIWYQGESNAEDIGRHERLFPLWVQSLRENFRDKNLPVYGVQLPGLDRLTWPGFRESQARLLTGPNLGFAVTLDLGDPRDVHPHRKQAVGERLARLALRRTYGRDIACDGPAPAAFVFEGGAARVKFKDAPVLPPVLAATPAGKASPFWVAGPDRVFVRAGAKLENGDLVVAAPTVKEPVAVRYAWEPDPAAVLSNAEGLPAAPFRSDDWPTLKVACIGDSITFGLGAKPETESYPARLAAAAGPLFDVRRFGSSGSCVVRSQKRADGSPRGYADTAEFRRAAAFEPDVIVCNLGINDIMADPFNAAAFTRDYAEILAPFMKQARPPKIVLWGKLGPLYPGQKYFGNPRREAIEAAIMQVAKAVGADAFDAQTPLAGQPEWFPDHIHPDKAGYETLARAVAAQLRAMGLALAEPRKDAP